MHGEENKQDVNQVAGNPWKDGGPVPVVLPQYLRWTWKVALTNAARTDELFHPSSAPAAPAMDFGGFRLGNRLG